MLQRKNYINFLIRILEFNGVVPKVKVLANINGNELREFTFGNEEYVWKETIVHNDITVGNSYITAIKFHKDDPEHLYHTEVTWD